MLECAQTVVCKGAYPNIPRVSDEMTRRRKPPQAHSQLRIIGGLWRGRKLAFIPEEGLRPTPDRVRETLFNWLAPHIHDARCLDLFAGSGALGLEALSRGAAHCDFVDASAGASARIADHLLTLNAGAQGQALCRDWAAHVDSGPAPYDIVFLDPPFQLPLIEPVSQALTQGRLLAPGALVYVETAAGDTPTVPDSWEAFREKRAGDVAYRLYQTGD